MINTTSKFVVIASSFRAALTLPINIERHVTVSAQLDSYGFQHKAVMGYYCEEGELVGSEELSLAIPCKTAAQIKTVARLFGTVYNQDCVAVWNRDSNTLWLADKEGHIFHTCGNMRMSKAKPESNAWTFDGTFYWYAE